ncbi:MAG: hypothetical protein M9890_11420 [Thermomicrobiales bacterium]|nr:hypothetical protein [Thermomicrobiales bacterium]
MTDETQNVAEPEDIEMEDAGTDESFEVGAFIATANGDIYRQPTPGSGFYGSGSNSGSGNDNHARWTTPGFQKDKWERGPLMPR